MRSCLCTPTVLLSISLGHHRESKGERETGKPMGRSCPAKDGEELERGHVVSGKTRYNQTYRRHGGPYHL